jgi:branched-chain amino acid aminotransferase
MAITAPTVWLDGALVPRERATIPLMAHAPQRGSLVFDVGSFHRGPRGVALFRAREHVARFLRSAQLVGIEVAWTEAALVAAAAEVVSRCGRDEGLVRWSAVFDADEPDLVPRTSVARVCVAAQLLEDPPRSAPLRVAVFQDARKIAPDAVPSQAKVAAQYLGPLLARRRAIAEGAEEVVLLDAEGNVAEAPTANVFAVVGGVLFTPPTRYVLAGITRDAVLELAREEGIEAREAPLSLEALVSADEAFLTATSLPLVAISHVNGRPLRAAPGPLGARLAARLASAQRGEHRAGAWLHLVLP